MAIGYRVMNGMHVDLQQDGSFAMEVAAVAKRFSNILDSAFGAAPDSMIAEPVRWNSTMQSLFADSCKRADACADATVEECSAAQCERDQIGDGFSACSRPLFPTGWRTENFDSDAENQRYGILHWAEW